MNPNCNDTINLEFNCKSVSKIYEPLNYNEIANLLNEFNISKKKSKWTSSNVSKICKRDYENILENLMEITTGFH